MKRGIGQKFLRIILMSGVFFFLGTQWSIGAEEKSSLTIDNINPEIIQRKIKQIETSDLAEESKKELTELYNLELENIEKSRSYVAHTQSFSQARKTAPSEMEILRNTLKEQENILPEKILEALETNTLQELVEMQEKEKANLSALEARLSDFNNQLVTQSTRPNIAREKLTELKSKVDIKITPKLSYEGDTAVMTQAEEWVKETQIFALSSEIKMLDQELLSHQERIQVLRLKRDIAESKVNDITTRIRLMDELLNKRRLEEVKMAKQQVETTQEESKNKHPLVRKLAEQNVALGEKLNINTLNFGDISTKEVHNLESVKRLEEDLNSIKQKLNIAGMNQEYGAYS